MTLRRGEHKTCFLIGCGEQGEGANQGRYGMCTLVLGKLIHCKWGPGNRVSTKHLDTNI